MLPNIVMAVFLLAGLSAIQPDPAEQVTFHLYTRTETEPHELKHNFSGLDANKPTFLIIHGFGGSAKSKSSLIVKDALISSLDCNAVVADWAQLARSEVGYDVAVTNTLAAGRAVGGFLQGLLDLTGAHSGNVTVVGFSLGAHVAGVAAAYVGSRRLPRIVALDAAGPMYDRKELKDRLDAGDADFVLAIHTSGNFFGLGSRVGHVDFYPNGGRSPQPPCTHAEMSQVCSHHFASVLFAESVYNPTAFLATKCSSWSDYTSNKCQQQEKVYMGINTPSTVRGDFYLRTRSSPPYGDASSGRRAPPTTPQDLEMEEYVHLEEAYDAEEHPEAETAAPGGGSGSGATSAAAPGLLLALTAATAAALCRR